ncbi:hypothetical protein Hanom_Chr13g01197001 [Helianthus anomalus]
MFRLTHLLNRSCSIDLFNKTGYMSQPKTSLYTYSVSVVSGTAVPSYKIPKPAIDNPIFNHKNNNQAAEMYLKSGPL